MAMVHHAIGARQQMGIAKLHLDKDCWALKYSAEVFSEEIADEHISDTMRCRICWPTGPKQRKKYSHFMLPDGRLVRLVRWFRDKDNIFSVRVTSGAGSKNRHDFPVSWFDEHAVSVGSMERQF